MLPKNENVHRKPQSMSSRYSSTWLQGQRERQASLGQVFLIPPSPALPTQSSERVQNSSSTCSRRSLHPRLNSTANPA